MSSFTVFTPGVCEAILSASWRAASLVTIPLNVTMLFCEVTWRLASFNGASDITWELILATNAASSGALAQPPASARPRSAVERMGWRRHRFKTLVLVESGIDEAFAGMYPRNCGRVLRCVGATKRCLCAFPKRGLGEGL